MLHQKTFKTGSSFCALLAVAALLCLPSAARAEQKKFDLDPAQTKVDFTLGDVLHTVHGNFKLKSGSIQFDEATGQAGGAIVIDATSGDSGSKARDKKMHKEILESEKFPEIIFTPRRVTGSVGDNGNFQVTVDGMFTLHGQSRPMTMTIQVQLKNDAGSADTKFVVPYQQWGVKNPSTFILRVSDKVEIGVHAVGRLEPAKTAMAAAH